MKLKLPPLKITGPALIVIAALLWSLDGILRGNLRTIPAASLVTFEHFLGLIPLIPFLFTGWKELRESSTTAKVSLTTTALISGTLGTIFYSLALGIVFSNNLSFSLVVLMQQLQPVIAITLAAILLKEKLNYKFVVSAVFALIGAYMIYFPNLAPDLGTELGLQQIFVMALAFAAALSWGAGTVFSRSALKELSYKTATAYRFLITVVFSGLFALFIPAQRFAISAITGEQVVQLLVIVFSAGMVALLIYYKGLSKTQAKVSTIMELAWPISAFAIDLLRGVEFAPTQVIGSLLLMFMIVRIGRMRASQEEEEEAAAADQETTD